MIAWVDSTQKRLVSWCARLAWLAPLSIRVVVGTVFVQAGWGKLGNLAKVTQYFQELGIPAASIQAPMVATVELVFGGLVLVGLFSRVAALPLLGTMTVALVTAFREDITSVSALFGIAEFLYIVLLVTIVLGGPGAVSFDRLWVTRMRSASPTALPKTCIQSPS